MSSFRMLRLASRAPSHGFAVLKHHMSSTTAAAAVCPSRIGARGFGSTAQQMAEHGEETFEEFTSRFEKEFEGVRDVFELQRNLNNAFAYDLVPSPSVISAALKAARRVNDFPTAVRIFEGIKAKTENTQQYKDYLEELKPLREELGVNLKEDLYPEAPH
ncbi:MAG: hypothetical protein LQ340_000911 [Diploschistes diacapsis]|nr:MAG: hypothetical protein LQ340_000911 [Diploschistes diacapsis]